MGQLNIEHLLQATSPRSERPLVIPVRGGTADPAFGDHLARVAAPSESPRKPDPRSTTETVETPISSLAADERPFREETYTEPETNDEAHTATHPGATNTNNASQKDNHERSSPGTDDAKHAETRIEVEGDQSNAEENGSSDDTEKSEIAAEAALLVNSQAMVQSSNSQLVVSGEGVATQETAAGPEVVAAKLPATSPEAETATNKSGMSIAKMEPLQTEQTVDTTATRTPIHGEETAMVEKDGAVLHQKKESSLAEKIGEVTKAAVQTATQSAEGAGSNAVTTEATLKLPAEVERNSERPARSNRSSVKKDRLGVEDVGDDGANKAIRSTARTEITNNNASPATNPAAALTTTADTNKPTPTDNSVAAPQKTGRLTNSPAAGLVNSLDRLQRSGRVTGGDRSSESNDALQVDVARFVGRVSKAFQTAQQRGGSLQLRLSPPELGALRLELQVKDGAMTAALQTETDAARRVLLDHLPALRDRLAEQNIRIERFDVDVRREDNGGQADSRMLQQQQQQQERGTHAPTPRRAATRASVSMETMKAVPLPTTIGDGTGLNVVA